MRPLQTFLQNALNDQRARRQRKHRFPLPVPGTSLTTARVSPQSCACVFFLYVPVYLLVQSLISPFAVIFHSCCFLGSDTFRKVMHVNLVCLAHISSSVGALWNCFWQSADVLPGQSGDDIALVDHAVCLCVCGHHNEPCASVPQVSCLL